MASATSVMDSERGAPLRAMMRARLLLGFYSDIANRACSRLLARIYCVALIYAFIILLIIYSTKYQMNFVQFLPVIFEYVVIALYSILAEESLVSFCDGIAKMDLEMCLHDAPFLPQPTKIILAVICTYKALIFSISEYLFSDFIVNWVAVPLNIINFALMLNHLYRCLTFDLLRHRLRCLRLGLKAHLNGHHINSTYQSNAIESCLKIYKRFVDILTEKFTWTKVLICLSYILEFIKLLALGSDFIWYLKFGAMKEKLIRIPMLIEGTVTCTLACLPAVFCELITKEVEELKLLLGNQQLLCDDAAVCAALEQAEEYLHLRRARVTLGRVCALDAALVLSFISFCTTYFIVMVQFAGIT